MPFGYVGAEWLTKRRPAQPILRLFKKRLSCDCSAHCSVLSFEPLDPAILNGDVFLERAAAHGYLSSELAFLDHQFGHNWFPPLSTSVRVQTAFC